MTLKFSNRLVPVILGVAQMPELRSHAILVRHVVHDLHANDFERAVKTLSRAHSVFGLSPIDELRRFIENNVKDIVQETKTDDWHAFVKEMNCNSARWTELTRSKSASELLQLLRSLEPKDKQSYDRPQLEEKAQVTLVNREEPEDGRLDFTSSDDPVELPTQPLVRGSQASNSLTSSTSINFRAAVVTFLIVLSGFYAFIL